MLDQIRKSLLGFSELADAKPNRKESQPDTQREARPD